MAKHLVTVVTNNETPQQEEKSFTTDGYLFFYLDGEKIRTAGDIEIKALGPVFLKLALEKFAK